MGLAAGSHETDPHDPVIVGVRLDPIRHAWVFVGDDDAQVRAIAHRVLLVDVALAGGVVREVLHPVVAQLEIPVLCRHLLELDDERHVLGHPPVPEFEVAVVGRATDSLLPLAGEMGVVLPSEQIVGPTLVVGLLAKNQLAGNGEPFGHVLRRWRLRLLVFVDP